MTRVYSAAKPYETEFIKAYLESNGIKTIVMGTSLSMILGEIPPWVATSHVYVVNDQDADMARSLIAKHHPPVSPTHCANCGYNLRGLPEPRCPECGQPFRRASWWICPTCGEKIEDQFTDCWKCAAKQPET